tara:strand:+ start:209 stop:493 length:285 start_codon:yes stop_codon:yes gene_type:complete
MIRDLWKRIFRKRKTEHELFLEFMATAKDRMTGKMEKAQLEYLEGIYKFAVKSQKKLDKKKPGVSVWISQDLAIDQKRIREQKAKEDALPHPTN